MSDPHKRCKEDYDQAVKDRWDVCAERDRLKAELEIAKSSLKDRTRQLDDLTHKKESLRNQWLQSQLSVAKEVVNAALGLSYGTDWNKGTHAITHGYRQKLLNALAKYQKLGRRGNEMPGEISRSNPGPKGNTPIIPSWIEKMNNAPLEPTCVCGHSWERHDTADSHCFGFHKCQWGKHPCECKSFWELKYK